MIDVCESCNQSMEMGPTYFTCSNMNHWSRYVETLENQLDEAVIKLEQHDDDRDKLDVADWLERYKKTTDYNCSACGRHYELPTHMTIFTCVCGQRCRLRHVGGTNPDQAVIDAAIKYFGTERMAQLAYIAEIVGGEYAIKYTADEIRQMIRQEMDRWVLEDDGWRKK